MRSRFLVLVLFVLLAPSGCEEAQTSGAFEFQWKIGTLTCSEASLNTVRAEVYSYSAAGPVAQLQNACSDTERKLFLLKGLNPGDYTLFLRGLDASDCVTHEVRRDITVWEGRTRRLEAAITLPRKRRGLSVSWGFIGGGELDEEASALSCVANCCEEVGIEQMEIRVTVSDLYDERFLSLCDIDFVEIGATLPPGELEVSVRALDHEGNAVAYGSKAWNREIFTAAPCESLIPLGVTLDICDHPNCESF